ncbi:hypothetical protein ACFRH4_04355 [Streptomyces mirabilis]|uniref:VMAP-C domain-containing protein n=1 Tax=Streptomyces mirabilis TaxID=68239 RepID=UPI003680A7E2
MIRRDVVMDELAGILLRLDGFRDELTRQVILEELAEDTGEQIAATGTGPAQQARSLVLDCARHPRTLSALASLLRDFHGDTADTFRFRELVSRLGAPPLLTAAERDTLRRVLRSWEDDGWRSAYAEAASLVPEPPRDLRHAVELLEDLVLPPGNLPPLLHFVVELAARSAPDRREPMLRWADAVAQRLGLPPEVRYEITRPNRSRPRENVTLVLRLQRFLPARSEYLLSVWLGHRSAHRSAYWIPLVHEDEPQRIEQISDRIEEFLATARQYDRAGPSRIEFMLPRDMMNLAVDQWLVRSPEGGPEQPLGHLYPVVLRDQDRQHDPHARTLWEHKWQRLTMDRFEARSSLLLDAADPMPSRHELARRLEPALTVLVGGMESWPERGVAVPPQIELALECGVPIMVWSRRGSTEGDRFLRDLAPRLADVAELARLPDTVRALRSGASTATGRPRSGIALLYDDPDHSPLRTGDFRSPL